MSGVMNLKGFVITLTPAQNGGWSVATQDSHPILAKTVGAFTSTEEMVWHLAAALCPNMSLFGDAAPQGVRVQHIPPGNPVPRGNYRPTTSGASGAVKPPPPTDD